MAESILDSVKKVLGIDPEETAFDTDVLMHINTAIGVLHQLGIGPFHGLYVEDSSTTWDALIGTDARLSPAKTLVYLRVRMLFDPPTVGAVITAMQAQIDQLEWRLNVIRENAIYGKVLIEYVFPDSAVFTLDEGTV